jgi:hypothetical protein
MTGAEHPFAAGSENPPAPPPSPALGPALKPAHVTKDLAVAQAAVAFAGLCTAATKWLDVMTRARMSPNDPGGEQDGRR